MRFNRSGHFNVPFCKKPARFSQAYVTKIVNQVDAVSQVVRSGHFDFRVSNFRRILDDARSGDLIYCDPPYIARHADYFNSWSEDDERALADGLRMTSASFILSTWSHNDYRMNDYIDSFWGLGSPASTSITWGLARATVAESPRRSCLVLIWIRGNSFRRHRDDLADSVRGAMVSVTLACSRHRRTQPHRKQVISRSWCPSSASARPHVNP